MTNEDMFNRAIDQQQKNGNYSPSSSYNFNQNQTNHSYHRNKKSNQHRNNKELHLLERMIKQNDIIIRILKDIREKLPEPPKKEKKEEIKRYEDSIIKEPTFSKNEDKNGTFFVENLTEEQTIQEKSEEETT